MRDWIGTLAPASYRGFAFHVATTTLEGGRQVPVHEYVASERHDTEDLGRKASKAKVKAYLASDAADAESRTFFRVLTSPGTGLLVLPYREPFTARCVSVSTTDDDKRLGWVGFDLEFVDAGGGTSGIVRLADIEAAAVASGFAAAIRSALGLAVAALGTPLALASMAGSVAALTASLDRTFGATEDTAAAWLKANDRALLTDDPVEQAGLLADAARTAGASARLPWRNWTDAADLCLAIPAASASPAVTRSLGLARAASAAIESACMIEALVSAASDSGRTREAAAEARAVLASRAEAAFGRLGEALGSGPFDVAAETLRLALVGIDDRSLRLAPLAEISTPRPLPASVLAWMLYGDIGRAEALVDEAGTMTPAMMPMVMIVEAP
jgi:prophage DNA circulation protein